MKRKSANTTSATNAASQNTQTIQKIVQQLPAEQKEVLVLRQYAGLSFKEIAEIMNCSIEHTLLFMRQGLLNIKSMLSDDALAA